MKYFPSYMHTNNLSEFHTYRLEYILECLRTEITEHIIYRNGDEKDYFSFDNIIHRFNINNDDIEKIKNVISMELSELGYKLKFSYGGTGLFIYTNNLPSLCYDQE
jgi:hypothetical protein